VLEPEERPHQGGRGAMLPRVDEVPLRELFADHSVLANALRRLLTAGEQSEDYYAAHGSSPIPRR
jgi:FXSXX-COOH protein